MKMSIEFDVLKIPGKTSMKKEERKNVSKTEKQKVITENESRI